MQVLLQRTDEKTVFITIDSEEYELPTAGMGVGACCSSTTAHWV
jgi:hypothetical protein